MHQKLPTFREYINEELKDKEFKKFYDEEGRSLEIGFKIARLRNKVGFTQKQLAEKIKTSQTVISRLESGNYWQCSLRTLGKIALATNTHLDVNFRK